jgi:hypothetical protein
VQIEAPQQPRSVQLQAQAAKAPRPTGCKTVFVKNLPYQSDEAVSINYMTVYTINCHESVRYFVLYWSSESSLVQFQSFEEMH